MALDDLSRVTRTLSVVIATRNRPDPLRQTLASIARCAPPPDEVIVVDGSDDRSVEEVVSAEMPAATYLLASRPGLTRQRNLALDHCAGEIVLFVDDDVELDPSALGIIRDAYREPDVVGATGRVDEPLGRAFGHKHDPIRRLLLFGGEEGTFTSFGYPRYLIDLETARDVEFMQGCFMSALTSVARDVRFDEQLPGYALGEDEDFSCRLSRRGRIRYLPTATLTHLKAGFSSQEPRAFGRLVVRNRAYLFRKNFPQSIPRTILFLTLLGMMVAQRLVNREWRGALGLLEGTVTTMRPRRRGHGDGNGPGG